MAKVETKHTSGPWTVSKSPDDMIVCDSEGGSIADCAPPGPWMTLAEARANAAFIVTACNSHADLLEQVKLFEKSVEYQIRVATSKGDDEGARLMGFTLHLVRESIAKASALAPLIARKAV
jgi:hypothetical protein